MGCVPRVAWGFFPLDEELQLRAGGLTPRLEEELTHLATWMPFERARAMLRRLRGVEVSEATVRRHTEGNGAAYEAVQREAVQRLAEELPAAVQGPARQLLSVDGVMVPLVGGEWAEVKTLVVGELGEPVIEEGEARVHARELSYFARLMEAEEFTYEALVETERRGVETAQVVVAVTDGAVWEQGFIDYHRPDAVRILDFAHAAEYMGRIGAAVWGEGTSATQRWLEERLRRLKREGPAEVLAELRRLVAGQPGHPELEGWLAYLEKRAALMPYPQCQAQGWPLGSGAVESANKLVVEARLKGAGMHWASRHVNPLLALRTAVCSGRWDEAWAQIDDYRRRQAQASRQQRAQAVRAGTATPVGNRPGVVADPPPRSQALEPGRTRHAPPAAAEAIPPRPKDDRAGDPPVVTDVATHPKQPWRPPPDHPWRRYPARRPTSPGHPRQADAKI